MEITFLEECTSTNQILIEQKPVENAALVAFSQSMGRGRRGRDFFSPKDTGIYLSICLHPLADIKTVSNLTTMMAVAASEAIEKYDTDVISIKWVNDLYCRGKKIAGILTECSPTIVDGKPSYVVVGIGVNVYPPSDGFPKEISDRAGAVFTMPMTKDIRKQLSCDIINRFMEYYAIFPDTDYIDEYRKRCFIIGKEVDILGGPTVRVLGVDDDFSLRVQYKDGSVESLRSGEVSLVL